MSCQSSLYDYTKGLALSPYLFVLVMNKLTTYIQDGVLWCMLFADDIVLTHETKEKLSERS